MFFDYASQNFSVVINDLWPTEKLSSLQMWSVQLAGLEVAIYMYVYLSIKFVMHVNIKNGQHNHKAIVAANTCYAHAA